MMQHLYIFLDPCPRWRWLTAKAVMTILVFTLCFGIPQIAFSQTNSTVNNLDEEIIYIDGSGKINVIDTNQTGPALVDWSSPEINFTDFAVGDFNDDGDYEIVGIKGGVGGPLLIVYDPVVLPGALTGTNQTANGIYWIELYRTVLPANPVLIETGNFDVNIPGDEIIYVTQTGFQSSKVTILARDLSLPAESADSEARNWLTHTETGNFPRTWQHIDTGQVDEQGADEIVLVDSTRDPVDDGIRSKIAVFRVDDGGLATMTPFFERENRETSWRYAEIVEMNGSPGAEIATSRSSANLLPNLHIFTYDMARRTLLDRGDGCPDEPHESLACPDDVFSLHISPSPRWVFGADVNGDGQDVAFFMRNVIPPFPNPVRLFGIDFVETFTFNLSPTYTANTTFSGGTQVYTYPITFDSSTYEPITFSDGTMIARDRVTTHWATYYDVSQLNVFLGEQNPVPTDQNVTNEIYNLWERGEGGDTDGDGTDELVIMRTDNIRTYVYRPNDSENWPVRREDLVATNNHSLKLANLDRNGTVRFASALAVENLAYTFVQFPCAVDTMTTSAAPPPYQLEIEASQATQFQAFATLAQPASTYLSRKVPYRSAALGQSAISKSEDVTELLWETIPVQKSSVGGPLVDWPSAVPWLTLTSPVDTTNTTLAIEVVPSGLTPNDTYQEAQIVVSPFGLGTEYERQLTIGFLCAKSQLFLPFFK